MNDQAFPASLPAMAREKHAGGDPTAPVHVAFLHSNAGWGACDTLLGPEWQAHQVVPSCLADSMREGRAGRSHPAW